MFMTAIDIYDKCFNILRDCVNNNQILSGNEIKYLKLANSWMANNATFDLKKRYCYMLACCFDNFIKKTDDIAEVNRPICKFLLLNYRKLCFPLFNTMESFLPKYEITERRLKM